MSCRALPPYLPHSFCFTAFIFRGDTGLGTNPLLPTPLAALQPGPCSSTRCPNPFSQLYPRRLRGKPGEIHLGPGLRPGRGVPESVALSWGSPRLGGDPLGTGGDIPPQRPMDGHAGVCWAGGTFGKRDFISLLGGGGKQSAEPSPGGLCRAAALVPKAFPRQQRRSRPSQALLVGSKGRAEQRRCERESIEGSVGGEKLGPPASAAVPGRSDSRGRRRRCRGAAVPPEQEVQDRLHGLHGSAAGAVCGSWARRHGPAVVLWRLGKRRPELESPVPAARPATVRWLRRKEAPASCAGCWDGHW